MAKKKYKDTGNPNDLTAFDYVYNILFQKDTKLPITKRYNYFQINMLLSFDYINVIHVNEACKLELKGQKHYDFLKLMVAKRSNVQMRDVVIEKESKEQKTAKGLLADKLELSVREITSYINELGENYLNDFIKEYSEEIKTLIQKKKYI